MRKGIKPINENERNINWEEVENKISIICRKFSNIEPRYMDDLAQELRIHAYYYSDDYYDLQRRAIDFWRTIQRKIMPEVPYFDLELIGGSKLEDYSRVEFDGLVNVLKSELSKDPTSRRKNYEREIQTLAKNVLDIIISDIIPDAPEVDIREGKDYKPYINGRISCSYLWEVMGEDVGSVNYAHIRAAMKYIEKMIIRLSDEGIIDIDKDWYTK